MSESAIRRKLNRIGFLLNKSRARHETIDDYGRYQIISSLNGWIVAGDRHELDLEDVTEFIAEFDKGVENR